MEKRFVRETELLDEIVFIFKRQYGFAPAKKNIHLLETSGYSITHRNKDVHYYNWIAFHVGGIGYEYSAGVLRIERNESYDM